MTNTSVKWFTSDAQSAPVLSGTAGSLIALLDAMLITGFGNKAVDSASVAAGVCRLNFGSGVSAAQDYCVIQLSGVTGDGASLNGPQRVKAVTPSYVEFPCDLPDGPLTGTITFKVAPLGWEKVFSKTNVAVYRSADTLGTRAYYRVDDTNALYARLTMYESMTDVDTGVGMAPTASSGGFYWHKRNASSSSGAYWVFAGDSRAFHLLIASSTSSLAASANNYGLRSYFAGDIVSYRSGDAWSGALTGSPSTNYSELIGCIFSSASNQGSILQRMSHGIGSAVQVTRSVFGSAAAPSGGDGTLGVFPSRADNGLRLSPILLSDGDMSAGGPRGEIPGAFHSPQSQVRNAFGYDAKLTDGQGVFVGRKLLSFGCGYLAGAPTGCGFIEVTGPWRL